MKYTSIKDLEISKISYGCMGLSHGYGAIPSEKDSIALVNKAYDLGCNFFDTAECYADGQNEILVGKAIHNFRKDIILATKFHLPNEAKDNVYFTIKEHLISSLKRLNTSYIDLYYYHRINPNIRLNDVALALGKLIDEGLIRHYGVSQASCEQIKLLNDTRELFAVQNEYSIMERMYEKEASLCDSLNIVFVPFSPMGAGFLSGKYDENSTYFGDDVRRAITRFSKENIRKNQKLLLLIEKYAALVGATKAQFSLSYIISKHQNAIPIPGMRKIERIQKNFDSCNISISEELLTKFEAELSSLVIYGNRTDEDIMKLKDLLAKEQ